MRLCPRCGELKPATDEYFYRRTINKVAPPWSSYCKECSRMSSKLQNSPVPCLIFLTGDGILEELVNRSVYIRKKLVRASLLPVNNDIYFTKEYGEDVYSLSTKETITFPTFMHILRCRGFVLDAVKMFRFNVRWRKLYKL